MKKHIIFSLLIIFIGTNVANATTKSNKLQINKKEFVKYEDGKKTANNKSPFNFLKKNKKNLVKKITKINDKFATTGLPTPWLLIIIGLIIVLFGGIFSLLYLIGVVLIIVGVILLLT